MDHQSLELQNATNSFFMARIAVMGFKCRALVLQGQLDASEHDCERLRAQVEQQQQQHKELSAMLARVKEDKMKLEIEKQNLDGVVSILDRDIKDLNAKLKVASETIERRDEEITYLKHTLQVKQENREAMQRQLEETAGLPSRASLPQVQPIPAKRTVYPRHEDQ